MRKLFVASLIHILERLGELPSEESIIAMREGFRLRLATCRRLTGEWCRRHPGPVVIGYEVSNAAWEAVIGDRWDIVCAPCFDTEAQLKGVAYEIVSTWPVAWSQVAEQP